MASTRTLPWGQPGNNSVPLYEISAENGLCCRVSPYGCRVQSLTLPAAGGPLALVLSLDTLQDYEKDDTTLCAVPGPLADRVALGRFPLNGKSVQLPVNAAPDCLHSGEVGFQHSLWQAEPIPGGIRFTLDYGPEKFKIPGHQQAQVEMTLPEPETLRVVCRGRSDVPGVFSPTFHGYFNLGREETLRGHTLALCGTEYAVQNETGCCTGDFARAEGLLDFSSPVSLPERLTQFQLDHFYRIPGEGLRKQAVLRCADTGVTMECWSDRMGLQAYGCNTFPAPLIRGAVCLEPQAIPNAVNLPRYRSLVDLEPGKWKETVMEYRFAIDN